MAKETKNKFKVEVRKNCKVCGADLPTKKHRTYCSETCRNKANYQKNKEYKNRYYRERRERESGKYAEGKLQCKICGKWYVQVGSHITQKHGMTAREYREEYNLPVKRGIVPDWFRKKKGEIALKNGTYLNLKKGEKYHYKAGDKKAKGVTFWKGRRYKKDNYYN
jgi:predicted transcriptional regulator